jgi:DNA-binding XRE family transcriptional regulator
MHGKEHEIENWRKFRKMFKQELADAVGLARHNISMIEMGGEDPSREMLPKFAEVLECTVQELLEVNPFHEALRPQLSA